MDQDIEDLTEWVEVCSFTRKRGVSAPIAETCAVRLLWSPDRGHWRLLRHLRRYDTSPAPWSQAEMMAEADAPYFGG